jgi:fosfomycin resistance protein FosX
MTVQGVSHLTFVVRDLERMSRFLCEGLGAEEVYDSAIKNFSLSREKFFVLGGVWVAAMEGRPSERSYRHVAFKVDDADLPLIEARLRSL